LLDDDDHGCLVLAGERATTAQVAFMVRNTSGFLCVAMTGDRLRELCIPLQVGDLGGDDASAAFAVSVDVRRGTTTGISAADRATTMLALADPGTRAQDLDRPGHVVPTRTRPGGVFERRCHTEAATDLLRLSGLNPVAAFAELVRDDGPVADRHDVVAFATEHGLAVVTIDDVVAHRCRIEPAVHRVASTRLSTDWGDFIVHSYGGAMAVNEHLALVLGSPHLLCSPLVYVQHECVTGGVFGVRRCDCRSRLDRALADISSAGAGVVVYLRNPGHGHGSSECAVAVQILRDLGVDCAHLVGVAGHGVGSGNTGRVRLLNAG